MKRLLLLILPCLWLHAMSSPVLKLRPLSVNNGLSQYDISDLEQDFYGFMWIATYDGLNRYDGIANRIYRHNPDDAKSISYNRIRALKFDSAREQLWIGTDGGGINIYDYGTDSFRHLYLVADHNPRLPENDIVDIESEAGGSMWIATRSAVFLVAGEDDKDSSLHIVQTIPYDTGQTIKTLAQTGCDSLFIAFTTKICIYTRQRESYIFSNELPLPAGALLNALCTDNNGTIFAATTRGLFRIEAPSGSGKTSLRPVVIEGAEEAAEDFRVLAADGNDLYTVIRGKGLCRLIPDGERMTAVRTETDPAHFPTENIVRQLYIDRSRTLWVSTSNKGLGIIDLSQKQFNRLQLGDYSAVETQLITRLMLDDRALLWIGTQKNGLYIRRPEGTVSHCRLPVGPVSAIAQSSEGKIWVAAGGKILTDAGTSQNPSFREFYPGNYSFADSLGAAFSICEDSLRNIWIGCRKGIVNLRGERHTVLPLEWQNQVRVIPDRFSNRMWVCTNRNGLLRLELDGAGNIRGNTLYEHHTDNPNSLSSSVVWCLTQTLDGKIYVGTDAGLNCIDPVTHTVTRFPGTSRLHNSKTLAITEDRAGVLWINTSQGLLSYDPRTGREMEYDYTDGLSSNSMTEAAVLAPDNTLYIGGNEGVNYFTSSNLTGNTIPPKVVVSGFRLFNKPISAGEKIDGRVILDTPIFQTREIRLRHFQNNFALDFSALSFNNPLKNKYVYRLRGYNDDWVAADATQRSASFSNLLPGTYLFELTGTNNDGIPAENIVTLKIVIRPAPWNTGWAYLLYTLLTAAVVYLLYRYYHKQQLLRQELLIEQIHRQAEHDANENKIRFYANITHELRTPLTLITAPLLELAERTDLDPKTRSQLGIMRRNSDRLLELVNQFLDLRKIDNQSLPLRVGFCDWTKVLGTTAQRFSAIAEQKQIGFRFETEERRMPGWVDPDKITGVVSNLLSNSFKFTPQGGQIRLSLHVREQYYVITVEDTGCGITAKDLPHIFERFYQADGKAASGTGIGLELVKRLVELHKGTIRAESTPGSGSCFRVEIPVEGTFYAEVEKRHDSEPLLSDVTTEVAAAEPCDTDNKPVILLVEDDEQMRSYIRSLLSADYRIIEVRDGNEGLQASLQEIPDLIVSDVMMPGMDGIELCRNIRNNFRISHIPVILLTAKNTETQGLESGALDYILKPFVPQNLLLRIRNLLQYRQQYKLDPKADSPISEKIARFEEEKERLFLEKACRIVEDHMSDSEFGVEEMIRILVVSRTQLHRKMTALTGKSASAFIRNIRLDKAREMLETGRYSISEVLYTVGYNSPSYFSKTYKERFGVLPSELLQK